MNGARPVTLARQETMAEGPRPVLASSGVVRSDVVPRIDRSERGGRRARLGVALVVLVALVAASCADGGGDDGATGEPTDDAVLPKVTVVGDSISFAIGSGLREPLAGEAEVVVIGEGGTGLARPDNFDWPTRLDRLAREFPPEVLVLSVGSNDHQDLTYASGEVVVPFADEAAWDAEYSRRLAAAVDPFADTGTTVVWVGQLRTADDLVGSTNRRVHGLAVEVAAERDHVEVADLGELAGTGDGVATTCLGADDLHLTEACTASVAEALAPRLPLAA